MEAAAVLAASPRHFAEAWAVAFGFSLAARYMEVEAVVDQSVWEAAARQSHCHESHCTAEVAVAPFLDPVPIVRSIVSGS